jgi:hypothetical protein
MENAANYVKVEINPDVETEPVTMYVPENLPPANAVITTENGTITVSSTGTKRGRGRPKGAKGVCSVCGQAGHNKRTCKAAVVDASVVEVTHEQL